MEKAKRIFWATFFAIIILIASLWIASIFNDGSIGCLGSISVCGGLLVYQVLDKTK